MANSDQSQYTLRFNEISGMLEYGSGNNWFPITLSGGAGINQLTGQVTAGPGSGSQVATVHSVTGVTDGSSATAGNVGEYMEGIWSGTALPTATDTWTDLQTISLTPGDWDMSLVVQGNEGDSTTITRFDCAISPFIGNDATGLVEGQNQATFIALSPVIVSEQPLCLARVRANITVPTIYYAKVFFSYTGGAPISGGRISARRMR